MLHYFVQYTSTTSFQLENFPDSQDLLQRYTSSLLNDDIITIKDTIDFLNALNELEHTGKKKKKGKCQLSSSNVIQ